NPPRVAIGARRQDPGDRAGLPLEPDGRDDLAQRSGDRGAEDAGRAVAEPHSRTNAGGPMLLTSAARPQRIWETGKRPPSRPSFRGVTCERAIGRSRGRYCIVAPTLFVHWFDRVRIVSRSAR